MVQSAINHWLDKGVSTDKMIMGIPFYGREPNLGPSRTYHDIISSNPEVLAFSNTDGNYYYNGIPEVTEKTEIIMENNLPGIMIWEVGQDAFGQYSLLSAIQSTVTSVQKTITNQNITIYPNPTSEFLHISSLQHPSEEVTLRIVSSIGETKPILFTKQAKDSYIADISALKTGSYLLIDGTLIHRFSVQE
jgi:GH18 family chitinase